MSKTKDGNKKYICNIDSFFLLYQVPKNFHIFRKWLYVKIEKQAFKILVAFVDEPYAYDLFFWS